jgi:hypothetical protein
MADTKTDPRIELNERIAQALGGHDVPWDVKDSILEGYAAAGGPQATWDELPAEVQNKIKEVEEYPATSWDDPADVPEDTPDDF